VKIGTPRWAVEAAAAIGAEMAERIGGLGVRVIGDRGCCPPRRSRPRPAGGPPIRASLPKWPLKPCTACRAAPHGALAAADTAKGRTVHRASSKKLVKALGHRCLKWLRRR
jgi:hypothetical protein